MALLTIQTTKMTQNQELSIHLMVHVAKQGTPERNVIPEPMQQIDCPL